MRVAISASYQLGEHNRARLELGTYDPSGALLIDPLISYSTYLGGSGDDYARAIAVDPQGAAYVTGSTESTDFSTAATTSAGASDAFVLKLAPDGEVLYST